MFCKNAEATKLRPFREILFCPKTLFDIRKGCMFLHFSVAILAISEQYPDLIKHLQQQFRLMAQLCLNGGVSWLQILMVVFVSSVNRKPKTEDRLPKLQRGIRVSLVKPKKNKTIRSNPLDESVIIGFISNLIRQERLQLLLGNLLFLFDNLTNTLITRFVKLQQRCFVNWRPRGLVIDDMC